MKRKALTQTEVMERLLDGHIVVTHLGDRFKMIGPKIVKNTKGFDCWADAEYLYLEKAKYYDPEPPKPEKKTVTMYKPIIKSISGREGLKSIGYLYEFKDDCPIDKDNIEGWITEEVEYEVQK